MSLKNGKAHKGIIEFEDIWKRRVTVRYYNVLDKFVYRLQLWYLKKIKKVITKIYYHEAN